MDRKLISWARAVKARRGRGRSPVPLPVLWLFTDSDRLPDPRAAAARLPPGLCGVVLRHDADPGRAALGRDLALICRARRNLLLVAGDPRLAHALGAGLHLRGGRRPSPGLRLRPITSSAHDRAELMRAHRAGAWAVFLSPLAATSSHPGRRGLGATRWQGLARHSRLPVLALGGVTGCAISATGRKAEGAGAIGALG